jgi:phage recombination protein Bet
MNTETRLSVTETMAQRFGMTAPNFEKVLRATVFPKESSGEQFAAFLLIAKKYNLDPIARELYAFPKPNGGIQPIVSVDGWMQIINSHPEMDGMEFEDVHDGEGFLSAIKCRIYRKDRKHPTEVIEYLAECRRNTDTWRQWPIRMLRHKAVIQAARYAFGFSGIVDPDEFERWTEPKPVEKKPLSKRAMAREFQSFEPTGEPETWAEPQVEEPPANPGKPMSTQPGPNDVASAAEAYEQGKRAFRAHANRTAWPAKWRDKVNIDAWLGGFDDEKIAAEIQAEEEERPA